MASTPPDILKHKMFRAPDELRKRVDELILDYKLGAVSIIKKVTEESPDVAKYLPSTNTLHLYVIWRRANPNLYALHVAKQIDSQDYVELHDDIATLTDKANSIVNNLQSPRDEKVIVDYKFDMLNDSKGTLAYLKKSITMKIQDIEARQQERYDKYSEQNLVNLYKVLKDIVYSEVKYADELKDSDKVPIADVKINISKLFDAVYMTIDRVAPDKKEVFKVELKNVLQYYRSNLLNDEIKEENK